MRQDDASLEQWILRLRNRYLLLVDLVLIPLAAYFAFVLRLERFDVGRYNNTAILFALLLTLCTLLFFRFLGGYSRYWPFASISELMLVVAGAGGGVLLATLLSLLLLPVLRLASLPRSIPVLAFLLLTVALAAPRFAVRAFYFFVRRKGRQKQARLLRHVLIVGAGEAGHIVLQEIQRNPQLGLQPVGFVDDSPVKQRLSIQGVSVLGRIEDIPHLVDRRQVDQAIIAIPSAERDEVRRIVEICRAAGVEVLVFPGISDLIRGNVQIERLRPIRLEDLLARPLVRTDTTRVRLVLRDRRVLVTGAGGSIGAEICRQVAAREPGALILLGHGENSIFEIHTELQRIFPDLPLYPVIADVRDAARIHRVFAQYQPEIVFHAAAHKHVPLMELNPEEAVTNNIGGTYNVLRAAEEAGCTHFVMISTDKAVRPSSVMGATKRVAEYLVQAFAARTGRRFVAVRFGNVLGSRGSVVPLFEQQIKAGGPVTVTHPEVRRYFMTIPEAVQLVLQAAALGHGGEVFVLDMGEPVRIVDLARDMIRLAGLEVGRDIEIVFTGLRPGEKLFEELFLDEETYQRTIHEKIFVSENGAGLHNQLEDQVGALLAAAAAGDVHTMLSLLRCLVPAYQLEAASSNSKMVVQQ